MKLTILGSGGGEGYPALFCNCAHCKAAKKAGGKSIRTLSQSCIDGKLLIDFPADSHIHAINNDVNFGDIENLLVTHTHSDHYMPDLFELRGGAFAHDMKAEKLTVYGNEDVKKLFDGIFTYIPINQTIRQNIGFKRAEAFKPFKVDEYEVTPLPAKHALEQQAFNYIIDDGKSKLLYLLDTGYPEENIFGYLQKLGGTFGCVCMDATMGVNYPVQYPYHMCFDDNIRLKERLLSSGLATESTRFIAMHITHNQAGLHEEIEKYFEESKIEVAFDGMQIEF